MPDPPRVVADASTLILLAKIGRFALLEGFHAPIAIASAVWREVVSEGQGRAGAQEVEVAESAGWLAVHTPQNQNLVRLLRAELDDGEAETIALALELRAELVLLDEREARRIAEMYGLRKTGVIGLLIRAKLEGKLDSLRHELNRLREEAGFWLDERLYRQALEVVEEDSD